MLRMSFTLPERPDSTQNYDAEGDRANKSCVEFASVMITDCRSVAISRPSEPIGKNQARRIG